MDKIESSVIIDWKLHKVLLSVGFISITIGVLSSYLNPATGYEVSIYGTVHSIDGTPILYWTSLLIALSISVFVAFSADNHRARHIAYGLGLLSFMSVVMLPLIRGWYYFAGDDALSHLGTTREFAYGITNVTDILYPFLHTLSVFVSQSTGTELNRTFLMVISAFVVIFVLFTPLTARQFSSDRWILGAGVFSGMLLLPINHISGDLTPQPSSQAMMYLPLVLFLLVFVLIQGDRRSSMLLILVTFTMVLLHPLHAAGLVLLLLAIAGVQLVHSTIHRSESLLPKIPAYLQASLLVLFFWVWVQVIIPERFERNFTRMIGSLFVETEAAGTVQTRGQSIGALGGSLEEMFVKIFLVSAVFCAICALIMSVSVINTFFIRPKRIRSVIRPVSFKSAVASTVIGYWTIGFAVASVLFFVYLLGGISDQYMRHYGFLMGSVTIIGAVSVGRLLSFLSERMTSEKAKSIAIVFVLMCLFLTLPVVFSSPYILQDSHHITEESIEGHTTAFEITEQEALHTSLRRDVSRYQDAILRGYDTDRSYVDDYTTTRVPDHFANDELQSQEADNQRDLHGFYDEFAYLYVDEKDRVFETTVLNGLRWSEEDFDYLEREQGINRVQDNGGFTLYAVENRNSTDESPSMLNE